MTTDIQNLIEKRPHLKDPLEFYDRWQRFQREAAEILPRDVSILPAENYRAYPPESVGPVFQLFVSIFDLPGEELEPVRRALESGEIDFMRLPLDELPAQSLPYDEEELAAIMFLFSRPFFLALQSAYPLDERQWKNGRCPLCSARPAFASITDGSRRVLHCSWCGTVGNYLFTGCPNCGTQDTSKLSTLVPEEEPGYRVAACDACGTYVKMVEDSVLNEMTADQADLTSLPLDIVAQERGYDRMVPNPIGLKIME